MTGYLFDETNSWDDMPDDYESTDWWCLQCDFQWYERDATGDTCNHPESLLAYGVPSRGPGESYRSR